MSRCGCGTDCQCLIAGTSPVVVTGAGTATAPYVISLGPEQCDTVMDCVGDHLAPTIQLTAGGLLAVTPSTNAGNSLATGSDGKLFVAASTQGGIIPANTATVHMTGTGIAGAELRADAVVSPKTPNSLTARSDGLYVDPHYQGGETTIVLTNASSVTKSVTFPRAFAAKPVMSVNLNDAPGTSAMMIARAINQTATGFMAFADHDTLTTTSVGLDWIAVDRTTATGFGGLTATRAATSAGFHIVTATCTNVGCPKQGVAVPEIWVPDDPAAWGFEGVFCGVCGVEITDLVPA